MTTTQDPIATAARLLRETAEELRQEYTLSSDRNNWRGDCVAKAAYDEHMAAAQALVDWEAAVGAGGVQPLRSAQERCKLVPLEPTPEMLAALMSPGEAEVLASSPSETFALMLMDRAGIRERYSAMLAASPTPPAEQQATSDPLDWPLPCDITAGSVTIGKGCPLRTVQTRLEVQAEANALLMRHLSREQAAPKAAQGELFDSEGFRAWVRKNWPDDTIIGSSAWWADHLPTWAQRFVNAAPQQEAQEPVAWESTTPGYIKYITQARYEKFSPKVQRWYKPYKCSSCAAPQPAPAPLSEREAFEAAWEKLHGKRPVLWSRLFAEHKMATPAHSEGNYFAATEQAAWKLWQARAALAAHGGE